MQTSSVVLTHQASCLQSMEPGEEAKSLRVLSIILMKTTQTEYHIVMNSPNIQHISLLSFPPSSFSRFLQLIQEKFPDVTLSPGWMVLHVHRLIRNHCRVLLHSPIVILAVPLYVCQLVRWSVHQLDSLWIQHFGPELKSKRGIAKTLEMVRL